MLRLASDPNLSRFESGRISINSHGKGLSERSFNVGSGLIDCEGCLGFLVCSKQKGGWGGNVGGEDDWGLFGS